RWESKSSSYLLFVVCCLAGAPMECSADPLSHGIRTERLLNRDDKGVRVFQHLIGLLASRAVPLVDDPAPDLVAPLPPSTERVGLVAEVNVAQNEFAQVMFDKIAKGKVEEAINLARRNTPRGARLPDRGRQHYLHRASNPDRRCTKARVVELADRVLHQLEEKKERLFPEEVGTGDLGGEKLLIVDLLEVPSLSTREV